MPLAELDAFERAERTTNAWLDSVAAELDTDDRKFALRVLRAWLHTVRDRLSVNSAAKFAAQLPELLRGIYFDGWEPSRVPMKYSRDEYLARFGFEARIRIADVGKTNAAVTAALDKHLSGGQLTEVLAQFPRDLRDLVSGRATSSSEVDSDGAHRAGPSGDRLDRLEGTVATLADAVETLARGLQDTPNAEPDPDRASRSARLATEILLAGKPSR
jgi:uncharacterized protein (DUF2267 family)